MNTTTLKASITNNCKSITLSLSRCHVWYTYTYLYEYYNKILKEYSGWLISITIYYHISDYIL